MAKITNIPDSDHVLRFARPKKHLLCDGNGRVLGVEHTLFKLRMDEEFIAKHGSPEKNLSVNYVEYFNGTDKEKLTQTVLDYCNGSGASRKTLKKNYFSKLNVGTFKDICKQHGAKVRIIHDASPNARIKSHGSINQLPQDNSFLLEDLCTLAFQNIFRAEEFIKL